MMKHKSVFAAVLVGVLLLAACGPTTTPEIVEKVVKETVVVEKEVEVTREVVVEVTAVSEDMGPESVELTIVTHTFAALIEEMNRMIDEYTTANPHVTIKYSTVSTRDLPALTTLALQARTAPDLMRIEGILMYQLADGGWLAPAPDWVIQDVQDNFVPLAAEGATYNGLFYGYNAEMACPAPIINPQLLEENGLEPPNSWTDVFDKMNPALDVGTPGALTQAGATAGGAYRQADVFSWTTLLWAHGAQTLNDDYTAVAFNTPEGLAATEAWQSVVHVELGHRVLAFGAGQSGMCNEGPFVRGLFQANFPDLKYEALLPLEGLDGHRIIGDYVYNWVVNKDCDLAVQEEAWKFAQYVNSKENQLALCGATGFLPTRHDALASDAIQNDPWAKAFLDGLEYHRLYYAPIAEWQAIEDILFEELERLTVNEVTPQEFLDSAQARVNEVLSKEE
jgi:ABC-type glycerol-3-phosphate transport system substrate-binding protein